jgi:hypothetical protein
MKSITKVISSGKLTPKELVRMSVLSFVYEMKNEKSVLDKKDIDLIIKNWIPKNNFEVETYNNYLKKSNCFFESIFKIYQSYLLILLQLSKLNTFATFLLYAPDESIKSFIGKLPEKEKIKMNDIAINYTNLNMGELSIDIDPDVFKILYIIYLLEQKDISELITEFLEISSDISKYSVFFEVETSFIVGQYYNELKNDVSLFNLLISQLLLTIEKKNTKINLDMFFFNPFIDLEGVQNSPDLNHSESI